MTSPSSPTEIDRWKGFEPNSPTNETQVISSLSLGQPLLRWVINPSLRASPGWCLGERFQLLQVFQPTSYTLNLVRLYALSLFSMLSLGRVGQYSSHFSINSFFLSLSLHPNVPIKCNTSQGFFHFFSLFFTISYPPHALLRLIINKCNYSNIKTYDTHFVESQ